ncbi:hypothetical protein ACFXKB_42895, partial [Streptomyces sp. NPDC059262]
MTAIAMVLGLGIALPFTAGVTPAFAQAELSITKTHTGNFTQGGSGSYVITVTNSGTEATPPGIGGIRVSDVLPEGLTVTDLNSSGLWNCQVDPVEGPGFLCSSTQPIPAGTVSNFFLTVAVDEDAPCSVTNSVVLSDRGTEVDSASDPTTITGGTCSSAASLSIDKSHTGSFTQGGTGSYAIGVSNAATAGPTTGTVTVTDTLPAGVTPTGASGTGWDCGVSGQTVTCTRTDALAAGASYPT